MKKFFYIISVLLFCGCTGTNTRDEEINKIEFGSLSSTPKREKVVLENLGASDNIIRLETNDSCILGNIKQIFDDENLIWVVAGGNIYKFDKNGSFIGKVGKNGQGPAEYIRPERVSVDSKRQIVYIIDYLGRKMMSYKYNGDFIQSQHLPEDYSLSRIALDESGQLYYTSFNNSITPDLLKCDLSTGKIDTISTHERVMGQEAFSGETFIYQLKGKTHLYHYFNDTVYTLDNNMLKPEYIFDLGSCKFTFKQLTIIGDETSEEPIDEPKMQITNFIDTENYIFISYTAVSSWKSGDKPDKRFAVYDKKNAKMLSDVYLTSKNEPLFSIEAENPIFASSDEHSIYVVKQASELADKGVIEGLDIEDNPILIKYSF